MERGEIKLTDYNNVFYALIGENLPVTLNPLTKNQYSQKKCLEKMLQMLESYLESDYYHNSIFTWLANIICLVAFTLCINLYPMNQLEIALLLMLLLLVMYTITLTNMILKDGITKTVRYMVILVQNDLVNLENQQQ